MLYTACHIHPNVAINPAQGSRGSIMQLTGTESRRGKEPVHMKGKASSNLGPIIRPESISKMVTDRLRDAILSSQLEPGKIYSEKELANQLGVSRTPVREAIRVLLAERIVIAVPGRGVRINSFSARDLEEVFELRKTIELAVLEKIAYKMKQKEIDGNALDRPKAYLEQQRQAFIEGDYSKIILLNRLFHTSLCSIGGNARMENVLNQTLDILQISAREFVLVPDGDHVSVSERGKMVMQEHETILANLVKGNATRAKTVMIQHLDQSLASILEVYRSRNRIKP